MHSPRLISIIKCHRHLPQWQCPLTATSRFQQQLVLDKTPSQCCWNSNDVVFANIQMLYNIYYRMPDFSLPPLIITMSPTLILKVSSLCFRLCFSLRATRYIFSIKPLKIVWYTCVASSQFHFHLHEMLHRGNLHRAQGLNYLKSKLASQFILLYRLMPVVRYYFNI